MRQIEPKRTAIMPDGNGCVSVVCEFPSDGPTTAPCIKEAKPAATLVIRRIDEDHMTRVPCVLKTIRVQDGTRYIEIILVPPPIYAMDVFLSATDKSLPAIANVIFDTQEGRVTVANPSFNPKTNTNNKAMR